MLLFPNPKNRTMRGPSVGFEILKLIGFKSPSVQPPTPHFDKFPTDCRQQKIQQTKMLVTKTQNKIMNGKKSLVVFSRRSLKITWPVIIWVLSLVEHLFVKKKSFARFALQSECCNFNQWEELNVIFKLLNIPTENHPYILMIMKSYLSLVMTSSWN